MKNENHIPTFKYKWKKILKGTPTKAQLRQYLKDIELQELRNTANA